MGLKDLPVAVGDRHVAAFRRAGWEVLRRRGSHVVMGKPDTQTRLCIPCNSKGVKRPLLAQLVKDAGLTYEEYTELFDG
jgi:predicted RNA binding protein YcfA (HicA-like mRNA interferase family)